ncbi:alpha/beta hydrolase [Babesia caballi]|uniref:Alpha/beta hydrolase n=1 Tax=Babesia caballi TaxID=5871 RepID=A0AAV4LRN2_BABCB|nr:alpha/beta hydrolase [Babesia caballi]
MTEWWNIQEPKTLKAALELLTAIRTSQDLRNEVCHLFSTYINGHCNPNDAHERHPVHKLLDRVTELRARIIGKESFKYGEYDAFRKSLKSLHACGRKLDACENGGSACSLNIFGCAESVVDILVKILPKLYITLVGLLAKLWYRKKWLSQACNDKNGVLHQWFVQSYELHQSDKCPYSTVEKLPCGFGEADMQSEDRGHRIKGTVFELVDDYGSLRTLIVMMKNSKYAKLLPKSDLFNGTLEEICFKCTCVPRATKIHEPKLTNSRVKGAAVMTRGGRSRRSAEQKPPVPASVRSEPASNQDVAATAVVTTVETAPETTAPGSKTIHAVGKTMTGTRTDMNPELITDVMSRSDGSGPTNNGIMFLHSGNESYQSKGPYDSTIYNVIAPPQSNTGSNSAACGAAAGLLAVGCVGVGAAYVFDIGGFGSMVNSMF